MQVVAVHAGGRGFVEEQSRADWSRACTHPPVRKAVLDEALLQHLVQRARVCLEARRDDDQLLRPARAAAPLSGPALTTTPRLASCRATHTRGVGEVLQVLGICLSRRALNQPPHRMLRRGLAGAAHSLRTMEASRLRIWKPVDMRVLAATMQ